MSIRYLAESKNYQVYSLYETVYLKDKNTCKRLSEYTESDKFITSIYGDPDSAIIAFNEEFIAIGGCGLSIYYLGSGKLLELFAEPDSILWTEGLDQSGEDELHFFRFTAFDKGDQIRVHRFNTRTNEFEILI